MTFKFQAKPFNLTIEKSGKSRPVRYWSPPDPLYRKIVREVMLQLLRENAKLKRDIGRPPSYFVNALVWAMRVVLRERER